MADYKKMYFELLHAVDNSVNILKSSMLKAETVYIETEDDSDRKHENKDEITTVEQL